MQKLCCDSELLEIQKEDQCGQKLMSKGRRHSGEGAGVHGGHRRKIGFYGFKTTGNHWRILARERASVMSILVCPGCRSRTGKKGQVLRPLAGRGRGGWDGRCHRGKGKSRRVPSSAPGISVLNPSQAPGLSQSAPRGAQGAVRGRMLMSLLKAGRGGPSHSEEDQFCPSKEICVIQQALLG